MEFVRSSTKVTIYGQSYDIVRPKVGLMNDLKKKLKQDPENALEYLLEFATHIGLPKEVAEDMEIDHLDGLIQMLCNPVKKN